MMKLDNNTSDIELMETMMKFKQGLGRLVRLEQQRPNRQIHILDGRLNQPRYKGFLSLIRALIDTYPNVLSMDYDDNR
jgi:Rad3-related DNA helicase